MDKTLRSFASVAATAAALLLPLARPAAATAVRIFEVRSAADFSAGTLAGVSLDPDGALELAPRLEKLASFDEPFALSLTALGRGAYAVGTGNDGKVFRVGADGKVALWFDAPEPEVFALHADPDGTLFVGTSPSGKVYRIAASAPSGGSPGAKAEVFFDPGATYIWAIRRAADGSLLVATGTEGKLYRVDAKGKGSVLYDAEASHIRSLLALADGSVVAGTAGEGMVVRIAKDGAVRTLADPGAPEVSALAAGPDGTIYAAVVASEASLVAGAAADPRGKGGAAAAAPGAPPAAKADGGMVTVTAGEADGGGARAGGGPRSEVFSIAPSGLVESIGRFEADTVFDLLWLDRLWVATGLEGKLFSLRSGRLQLERSLEDRQLVGLLPGAEGPVVAATNAAALYRTTRALESTGSFESAVLDAQGFARFGVLRWRGELPDGAKIRFSVRSGASAVPDRTWSAWSEPSSGREIAVAAPAGRFVQFRADFERGSERAGSSPRLDGVELSYRQENLKPRIEAFGALPPGQILVPATFNPSNQVYEPAHPNRDGIFTTLAPADEIDDGGRLKPLWKLGYRSLRWKASDPNGDALRARLTFRPVDSAGRGRGEWLPLADDLKEEYLSFDVGALPDGLYRFRLEVSDATANDPGRGLATEEVSPPVVVDHTPPRLAAGKGVRATAGRITVRLEDALSPLGAVEWSVDGGDWHPALAVDGLLDGLAEEVALELPANGARYVLLRATDAAYNAATFDLTSSVAELARDEAKAR